MWIGVRLVGDVGISAGSDDAISHDEFLGKADRKGLAGLAYGEAS
jgi:hypothetical protein